MSPPAALQRGRLTRRLQPGRRLIPSGSQAALCSGQRCLPNFPSALMLLPIRPHRGPAVARRLLTSFWPVRIPMDFLKKKTVVAVSFSGGQALPPGTSGWVGPLLPARGPVSAAPPSPQRTPPPAPRESMNFGSPAPRLTKGLRGALLPRNLAVAASGRKPFSFLTPYRGGRSPTIDSGSDVLRSESSWRRFSKDR